MKLWMGILCSVSVVLAADASSARLQDAASKAVVMIQKSQKNWYTKASCYSCHQQVLPALAFKYAREHGIAVDEAAAHADAAAAFGPYSNLERAVEYTHMIDPGLSDGYGLIAASAAGVRPSLVTAVYARLIAARQEADGHWETVDERPPQSYSPFTATAISLRAIQLYGHPSQKAAPVHIDMLRRNLGIADIGRFLDQHLFPSTICLYNGALFPLVAIYNLTALNTFIRTHRPTGFTDAG